MKNKNYKILKPNELIDAFISGTQANSIRLIDRLWYEMDQEVHKRGKLDIENRFRTEYSLLELKEFLGLSNNNHNYHNAIEEALDGLTKSIKIKNYIDTNGDVVDTLNEPLLSYKKYKNITENDKEKVYKISLSSELFALMTNKNHKLGKFTNLYSRHQQKLRTGNHILLYQRLKVLQGMKWKNEIDFETFKSFIHSKKQIKYISQIEEVVKRALVAINKHTDILVSHKVIKSNNSISFKIELNRDNMTNEEIAKTVELLKHKKETKEEKKQKEENNIIENLLNKGVA